MRLRRLIHQWIAGNGRLAQFLAVAVVTVVVAGAAFVWQTWRFEKNQERILELQEQEYRHLVCFINERPGEFKVTTEGFDVAEQVDKINNDTSRLLALEFTKIQSEYSALALWAALIMVAFLLFSFFSMFKSEELVKQGHDTVGRIGEMQNRTQTQVNDMIQASRTDLRGIEREARLAATEIKDTIATGRKELDEFRRKLQEDADAQIEAYKTRLTTIASAVKTSVEKENALLVDGYKSSLQAEIGKFEDALQDFSKRADALMASQQDKIERMVNTAVSELELKAADACYAADEEDVEDVENMNIPDCSALDTAETGNPISGSDTPVTEMPTNDKTD